MTPQSVFRFLSAIASFYMLLLIFRVLLSWFQGGIHHKGVELLKRVTDPYLDRFRAVPGLRFGALDFSPVIAISLLGLVSQILQALALSGRLTIWFVLALVLERVWRLLVFFLDALILFMAFRLVVLLFFTRWSHPLLFQLDSLLYKVTARILGLFTEKNTKYALALGISAGALLASRLLLGMGVAFLTVFLRSL